MKWLPVDEWIEQYEEARGYGWPWPYWKLRKSPGVDWSKGR